MSDPTAVPRDPADVPVLTDRKESLAAPPLRGGHSREHRRWVRAALVGAVVAGVGAGLLVWAPWTPPPVLRPAGLRAGTAIATSVTLRWSRPRTGPLPDRYLVLSNGAPVGSVPGSATSYRQADLNPASTYHDRLVAERGSQHSPASAPLTLATLRPPLSQARLQGTWNIYATNTGPTAGHNGLVTLQFSPACPAGACDVVLHGRDGLNDPVTVKLIRTSTTYRGQTVDNGSPCKSGATAVPRPITVKVRLRVTAAAGTHRMWAVAAWKGTMTATAPNVPIGASYCPGFTYTTSFNASKIY